MQVPGLWSDSVLTAAGGAPPANSARTVAEKVQAARAAGARTMRAQQRAPVWRPSFRSFAVAFPLILGATWWVWSHHTGEPGFLGYVTTVVWTLPFLNTVIGLSGGMLAVRRFRADRRLPPTAAIVRDRLLVVVPTVGRPDTYPALERAVQSFCRYLPRYFPDLRVDILTEEDCPAREQIQALADGTMVRVVTVPRAYQTPNGTRFKARANQYAHELRAAEGEARPDVWVLHMDDDTGVGVDTVDRLARFVNSQWLAGSQGCHLAQGVLSYPREFGANRLLWLADAVRPGCDISMFAATTGRGWPRAGLHGELLMIRASVEQEIGWDFGPRSIVEDAEFALMFCDRHPGRSDWFAGLSYGASPTTLTDFVRQRERWAWGLLELVPKSSIPWRQRLLLLHNVVVWASAPMQFLGTVLLAGFLLGDTDTFPVTPLVLPIWAANLSYSIWQYWEGLKINAAASARPGRRWWEPPCVVLLLPLFSLVEAVGLLRGLVRFARNTESTFSVITKPI